MRTNPLCYLAAFLLALGGWMAAAAIAATSWQPLKDSTVTRLDPGAKIDVTEHGVAFFTDLVQPQRGVACRSKPPEALPVEPAKFDLVNHTEGRSWHLLSTTVQAKAGTVSVRCTPSDGMIDTATYGYAELPSFHNADVGRGIGSMASLAAVILAAWTWWGRRTERKLASYESA